MGNNFCHGPNPPFGGRAIIDDPHVLSHYELPTFGVTNIRASMPAEQLFVEAALRYLKPGGYLAIVLPDSILNNPGLEFIRQWAFLRARFIASVDLSKETFAEGGGVPNPSVLVMQRLTRTETRLAESAALDDYEVFMSLPRTVGRDKRGRPIYYRNPEGFEVLDENQAPTVDDELPLVADAFDEWRLKVGYGAT